MSTIRYKKRYKKWYAYEITQYWDKKLKKPRQHTKYLGVANEKGGRYSKPGRTVAAVVPEKAILDYGDSFAINAVSKNMGLCKIIENSFGNLDSIMALICFQITEGVAMYNCEHWLEGNIAKKLFPAAKVNSQNISSLMKTLGRQDLQNKFFVSYISDFFSNNNNVLIDSTALPSAINSSINAFGYVNGNIEENVTCLMLADKKTKLPIYFRAVGGDIADITTLKTTIAEIKKLGLKVSSAVLDAGYCSKDNLQFMCQEQINFITRLPKSHKAFDLLIKQAGAIEKSKHALAYGKRIVFIKSIKTNLYDHEMYAHIIFDPGKRSHDTKLIFKDRLDDKLTENDKKELDEKIKTAGFLILLSHEDLAEKEVLPSYYERQTLEQIFGFAKHNNNILPLRVHSEQAVRGYLMLAFLALIVFVTMRQRLKMPMDHALLILRNLKAKIFASDIVVQEVNRKVKNIFELLGVIMPTGTGI
jgi:transposase